MDGFSFSIFGLLKKVFCEIGKSTCSSIWEMRQNPWNCKIFWDHITYDLLGLGKLWFYALR